MGKRILVGIDGSDVAERALESALEYAKGCDHQLLVTAVLQVGDLERMSELGFVLPEPMLSDAQAAFQEDLEKKIRAQMRKADFKNFDLKFLYGSSPTEELLKVIDSEKADCVFIGRTGKGAVSRVIKGSVAHALSAHASVPVTIVP